jgi:hypothetical protein
MTAPGSSGQARCCLPAGLVHLLCKAQRGRTRMITRRSALGAGFAALALPQAALAAAPHRGGQVAGWYRFKLGEFECTVVSDGAITIAPAHPTFGGNVATELEVRTALRSAFLPEERMQGELNCLVVNTGREVVLLDAGVGRSRSSARAAGGLPPRSPRRGSSPARWTSSPSPMRMATTSSASPARTAPTSSPMRASR